MSTIPHPSNSDFGASTVRTIAPYLTAFIVTKLAEKGFDVDAADLTGSIVVIGGSAWYVFVRWLEKRWPEAGKLLGVAKTPTYEGTTESPKV